MAESARRSIIPARVPGSETPRPAGWLRGVRILIVEDHADSRLTLRLMMESFGASVREAEEGHEGLLIAGQWIPDLILCDLRMPGMDGYTFLRRLQEDLWLRAVRIVAVSALASEVDVKRTRLAGFDGHVAKPIDYESLAQTLERILWGRLPAPIR
jgi:CheY-like chemotaxis protein